MESQQFKIGDVVQLKSGGPKMTVKSNGTCMMGKSNGTFACAYFADNLVQNANFYPEMLKLVEEQELIQPSHTHP